MPSFRSVVPSVLVDASALIALLDKSDSAHADAVTALATIREPLVTVWPALTEAMHLLRSVARGQEALFQMMSDRAVDLALHDVDDLRRMHELMKKYRDLPMDFADAALVTVAERDGLTRIFTFDAHFRVYRFQGRRRLTVIGPPGNR
jgi:predicted nucleic acid-binding protein